MHFRKATLSLIVFAVFVINFNTLFAQNEPSSLTIGDSLSDVLPSEHTELQFILDIPEDQLVSIDISSALVSGSTSGSIFYEVRDAEGDIVDSIPPSYGLYWTHGALPYTLNIYGSNYSYDIEIHEGDTRREDRGEITFGSPLSGQLEPSDYDVYTIEAEEGERMTMRYVGGDFGARLYPQPPEAMEDMDNWAAIAPNLSVAVQQQTAPFTVSVTFVYRFAEAGTYNLLVESANGGSYELLIDEGDTLPRVEIGTIAPGQAIETEMPPEDGNLFYIRLDVEAGESYVAQQWTDTRSPFLVVDAELAALTVSDTFIANNREIEFTVDEEFVLPIDLLIETLGYDSGEPLVFTLSREGEEVTPDTAEFVSP